MNRRDIPWWRDQVDQRMRIIAPGPSTPGAVLALASRNAVDAIVQRLSASLAQLSEERVSSGAITPQAGVAQTLIVTTISQALDAIAAQTPGVALVGLDGPGDAPRVGSPDISPAEALSFIRWVHAQQRPPYLLAVTWFASAELRRQAILAGADDLVETRDPRLVGRTLVGVVAQRLMVDNIR